MKLHMWVCRGQLKTPHTNIGHCDLLFLPEWLRHFALSFAFRSNVDKLLGPGWWNFTCDISNMIMVSTHNSVPPLVKLVSYPFCLYEQIKLLHTYSFKIMLFISTGIFCDKLRQQILSVMPTANVPLSIKRFIYILYHDIIMKFETEIIISLIS